MMRAIAIAICIALAITMAGCQSAGDVARFVIANSFGDGSVTAAFERRQAESRQTAPEIVILIDDGAHVWQQGRPALDIPATDAGRRLHCAALSAADGCPDHGLHERTAFDSLTRRIVE